MSQQDVYTRICLMIRLHWDELSEEGKVLMVRCRRTVAQDIGLTS